MPINTHVVITFTGGKYFITKQYHNILKNLNFQGTITLNKSIIHAKNIAEVLPIQEYYKQHPKEIPAPKFPIFTPQEDQINQILSPIKSKEKRIRALGQMMVGLKKYIIKNGTTGKAEKLLKHMETKLNYIKSN